MMLNSSALLLLLKDSWLNAKDANEPVRKFCWTTGGGGVFINCYENLNPDETLVIIASQDDKA